MLCKRNPPSFGVRRARRAQRLLRRASLLWVRAGVREGMAALEEALLPGGGFLCTPDRFRG